ncbi:MAG: amidohydrolase family protein [Chloroflexi bacterium]|nr:amidohydrolase family protein [Chloroflexota bacterium]
MTRDVDLLIRGGLVVTVDPQNRVLSDGAVAVHAGRIVVVGPTAEVTAQVSAAQTLDAHGKLVMPGIVDAYHHAGHGMIKGVWRGGLGWPSTPLYFHATTPSWWYADGLMTAIERLKFGVTTGVSVVGATPARADHPSFALASAKGVADAGLRAFIAVGPPDPFLNLGHDNTGAFWDGDRAERRPFTYEQTIEVTKEFFSELRGWGNPRLEPMFAVPYLLGMSPDKGPGSHHHRYSPADARLMRDKALEARRIANDFGVRIQTHGARGTFEWAESAFGAGVLDDVLGPDVFFAHANALTDADIDIIRRTGCGIAAVPYGPWNVALGPCPILKLLQNGVPLAITTDGAAPYFHSDPFDHLHHAQFLQWMDHHDQTVVPAGRVVRLVTIEAAALLGLERELGSLEPGKQADIILIDRQQPHLTPFVSPANMIAWYVRGNDVDTVIVGGQVVMQGRKMLRVDEARALAAAEEEIAKSFARLDVQAYLEHTHDYWQGWQEKAQPK